MKNEAKPVPERFHSVTPCLTLKDSREAIKFYEEAFDAKVLEVLPTPDGKHTMHAMIQIGDSVIMMGDEIPGQRCRNAETLGASPVSLYVYVPNVDKALKKAIAAGATEKMPVDDMFWGDRCGSLKDPFGYSWMIATHKHDLTEEQIQQGAESFFDKATKS